MNRRADLAGPGFRTSFSPSFAFLPPHRRDALGAVYAFCRATDDIADGEGGRDEKMVRLARWEHELGLAFTGGSSEQVLNTLAAASRDYGIPQVLFHDLIRGVSMDLGPSRFPSFGTLLEYCHLVASTVGLMCLPIFGRRNERTEAYARTLGPALQLTNIIRDVGEDARMGRLYLPGEDLERFGCREEDVLAGKDSPGFRALVRFEAERAEEYYLRTDSILDPSDLQAMRPARIMKEIYRRTLRKIRASGFDVLGQAIRLSRRAQLGVVLRYGVLGRIFSR